MPEIIVTSKKQLVALVKRLSGEGRQTLFGRIAVDRSKGLVLSDTSSSASYGALCELHLPDPSRAGTWWDDLWEGEIVDFRVCHGSQQTVICAAKDAVWKAIPEFRLLFPKSLFTVCEEEVVDRILGAGTAKTMSFEVLVMGVSVRRALVGAPTQMPKA